jgi:hypothetical protein
MVPSSGKVLVTLTAFISNTACDSGDNKHDKGVKSAKCDNDDNCDKAGGYMSFQVDTNAIVTATLDTTSLHSTTGFQGSATYVVTGLSAGSHTFTAKYRTTGNTETFANRSIIVIPLP